MIGKTLAHYEITALLGKGGMGEVYRARDTKLARDVALKVLPADVAADPERRGRFQREAQAVAALKHPNIVTIYSVEEDGGVAFFTMELIEGKSLADLLPKNGFSLEKTFELTIPLADAIAEAHTQNITHRDLKPANIMFDTAGRLKVLDFGLAKLLGPAPTGGDATITAAQAGTREGRILGTAAYMSPEQAEGKPVDHRSDIFSMGILLYEMVTGERPFQGETSMSTLSAVLKDTPSSVTDLKPSLPRHLARIVHRCLAKDPERRYQSMKDVRNELEELRQEVNSGEIVTTEQSATDLRAAAARESDSGSASHLMRPDPFWKKPAFLGGAALVLVLAAFGLSRLLPGDTALVPGASASPSSIAVFAFENLKDPDDPDRLGQILQELVITDLSSHDALDILSSQRLFDLHRQIAGSGASRIDRSTFTEVATQAGATAMLTGTLSQLGDRWILASQIVDLGSGKVTTSERIDGNDLYRMVDDLTGRISQDLAPDSEPVGDVAVAERTSSSLSAYQAYLEGIELLSQREYDDAEEKLEEALRLDPTFGQAALRLAVANWWAERSVGGSARANELLQPIVDGTLSVSDRDRFLARGMLPILEARYDEGESLMVEMTELYPDDKDAWYGLGEARYHKSPQDMEGAVAAFTRALELDPSFLPAFTHLEGYFTSQRRFDEAIRRYRGLLRGDPDHVFWYISLFYPLLAIGEEEEAETLLRESMSRFPSDEERVELLRALAGSYAGVGHTTRQQEYLEEALALDPSSAHIMVDLGSSYQSLDRHDEADAWFDRADAADPDDAVQMRLLRRRTWRALDDGRNEEAIRLASEYLERGPGVSGSVGGFSHLLLVAAYLLAGQPEEADRIVEAGLDELTSPGARQGFLAWCAWGYYRGGLPDRAVDVSRRGIAMEGGSDAVFIWDNMADFFIQMGRIDDAEAAARRTLELQPRSLSGGEDQLTQIDMLRGDPASAERRLRDILRDGPVTTDIRMALSIALAEQERYEEAEADARWAFERQPNVGNHAALAWVLIAGDLDVDEGISLAETAMSMTRNSFRESIWRARPFRPSPEHALGLGYLKKGRVLDAVRLLEKAAELQPDRTLITQHLDRARASN